MRQGLALFALLGAAACGAPMNVTYKGQSPQPVVQTMKCVAAAADSLGYKPKFVNGNKGVEAVRKDSVLAPYEDSRTEKITASGSNSSGDLGASSLIVVGATFSGHWTRIGLETDEIPASAKVIADAQKVLARCGGGS